MIMDYQLKDKCPCKKCITYAMCKAESYKYKRSDTPPYIFIYRLTAKCSMMDKYLDKTISHDLFQHRLQTLELFYELT